MWCGAQNRAKACWPSMARPMRSTRAWSSSPMTRASNSLAGVMGGEASGCDETTTDVLIESALWESAKYRPDRPQARHRLRCALSLRARRRSGLHPARRRTGDASGAGDLRRLRLPNSSSRVTRPTSRNPSISPSARSKRLTGLRLDIGEMAALSGKSRLCRRGAGQQRRARPCARADLAARYRKQGRSGRGNHPPRRTGSHRVGSAGARRPPSPVRCSPCCRSGCARRGARLPRAAWSKP